MKAINKIFLVLLIFSFFHISSIPLEGEMSEVTCIVDLGGDVITMFWDSVQLDAVMNRPLTEVEEFTWSPTENLSCTNCLDPFVKTYEDVCVSLTVEFTDGCIATDEVCIFIDGCNEGSYENQINSITPMNITENAEIELEIARKQFTQIDIVQNDEILYSIFEGWVGRGLNTLTLDFSSVPAGEYSLRVKLYPEDKYVTITKL